MRALLLVLLLVPSVALSDDDTVTISASLARAMMNQRQIDLDRIDTLERQLKQVGEAAQICVAAFAERGFR